LKISAEERDAVYKTIFARRDVRGEFLPDQVPEDVLMRILQAAHHAPSVGFMQPWDFIVVRSGNIRGQIKKAFDVANQEAAAMFDGDRAEQYRSLKLEGITEAPLGIVVTCDRERTGDLVLGRTANPEMDLYSAVCAVQNLWLAARAENLGMGWVSIIHHHHLRNILKIPEHIMPIAYCCIGYTSKFHDTPDLERKGWLPRREIGDLLHFDHWGQHHDDEQNQD